MHHTIRLNANFLDNYPNHAAHAVYVSDGLVDATTVDCLYLERPGQESHAGQADGRVRKPGPGTREARPARATAASRR